MLQNTINVFSPRNSLKNYLKLLMMTKNYFILTKTLIFVKECNIDFMWRSQFDATFLSGLWELWKKLEISYQDYYSLQLRLIFNCLINAIAIYYVNGNDPLKIAILVFCSLNDRDFFMRKTPFQKIKYLQLPSIKCQPHQNLKVFREKEKRI